MRARSSQAPAPTAPTGIGPCRTPTRSEAGCSRRCIRKWAGPAARKSCGADGKPERECVGQPAAGRLGADGGENPRFPALGLRQLSVNDTCPSVTVCPFFGALQSRLGTRSRSLVSSSVGLPADAGDLDEVLAVSVPAMPRLAQRADDVRLVVHAVRRHQPICQPTPKPQTSVNASSDNNLASSVSQVICRQPEERGQRMYRG